MSLSTNSSIAITGGEGGSWILSFSFSHSCLRSPSQTHPCALSLAKAQEVLKMKLMLMLMLQTLASAIAIASVSAMEV
jgi:hypothetical protein